jgi:hypothetical protein
MVYRLVCLIVIIIPHHVFRCFFKKIVEIGNYFFFAAHQLYHAINIVRYKPALLVRVGFKSAVPLG